MEQTQKKIQNKLHEIRKETITTKSKMIDIQIELRNVLSRYFKENQSVGYKEIIEMATEECRPMTDELARLGMKDMYLQVLYQEMFILIK